MSFQPRPYQLEAIQKSVEYFHEKKEYNGFVILPTGSGKSIVIANIAKSLPGKTIVFQPSKEILEQNYAKFISYGYRAGIYSASAGQKYIDDITFATIGSVIKKKHLFSNVKNIIIDECHLVAADGGMYHDFIKASAGARVLGLTATPYRLHSTMEGAMLKFLNRTNPRIFNKVLFYVQNNVLFESGHLAPLNYYDMKVIDRSMLDVNSSGSDFTDASIKHYYRMIDMVGKTVEFANRLLKTRKNLLVFAALVDDAIKISAKIPGSVIITGETDKAVRAKLLADFKAGRIRCVVNVGVLTTGFDYPGLEAILIARSTMSLALYYQMVGRVMRPYKYEDGTIKTGWIVDMGGNIAKFGKIETMEIRQSQKGLFSIWNEGKQLTNVTFSKN